MYPIEAHDFVGALANLDQLDSIAETRPEWVYGTNVEWFNQNLNNLSEQLKKMRLRLSLKKADYIRNIVSGDRVSIHLSDASLASMVKLALK
jgi:predicted KAP-like P-loop ATPase